MDVFRRDPNPKLPALAGDAVHPGLLPAASPAGSGPIHGDTDASVNADRGPLAAFTLDGLVIQRASAGCAAFFESPPSEIVGRDLRDACPEIASQLAPLIERAAQGETIEFTELRGPGARGAEDLCAPRAAWSVWEGRLSRLATSSGADSARVLVIAWDTTEQVRAQRRERLIAHIPATLGTSLELEVVADKLAHALVPALGDWCVVDRREGGVARQIGSAAVSYGPETLRGLAERWGAASPDCVVARVHDTATPEMLAKADTVAVAAMLGSAPPDAVARLGASSFLCVPVCAHGHVFATISLVFGESGRRYSFEHSQFAARVAAAAAPFVENAVLYQQAQEAVRVRNHLISVAAHELRTPLTALRLQLGFIDDTIAQRHGDEKLSKKLSSSMRQIDRIGALVDGLLDVSRMSTGKFTLDLERCDLAAMLRDLIERCREQAIVSGCDLRFECPEPLTGLWDSLRIEQVVTNLLSNAIKFGAGKPVQVQAHRVDGRVVIQVTDSGIGILPEHAERLFGRFERGVSGRSFGGFGLGLFIAREIVQAHGGEIRAAGAPGEGAIFTVELPIRTPPAEAEPPAMGS